MPASINNTLTAERVSALRTYEANKLSTEELLSLTARPRIDFSSILQTVGSQTLLLECDCCRQPCCALLACLDPPPTLHRDFQTQSSGHILHSHVLINTDKEYCMRVQVEPIVEDVRQKGDAAVRTYTKQFDKVDLNNVCIPIEVCSAPEQLLCPVVCSLKQALQR